MVEWLRFLILGLIQGLTEPLPISSSGHMVIAQVFLDIPNLDYFLEIFLHFASLIAIVILFKERIIRLIKGNWNYLIRRKSDYRADFDYLILIIIGVFPAALIGVLFKSFFEGFLTLIAVGISLLITGTFLFLVQKQSVENTKTRLNVWDALTVGLVQVLALFPGISRSGSTFVGGLLRKIKFETLIEFSFMLYIPISLGGMIFELFEVESFTNYAPLSLVVSFIATLISTYFAFKLFVHLVKQGNLKYFGVYCYFAGVFAIVLSFIV